MAKGSNSEHFLLIVLSFCRECLASKRFSTRVRDVMRSENLDASMQHKSELLPLEEFPTLSPRFLLSSLSSQTASPPGKPRAPDT